MLFLLLGGEVDFDFDRAAGVGTASPIKDTVHVESSQVKAMIKTKLKISFALLLKFYGRYGRFPRGRAELRDEAVEFVAAQVRVPVGDLGFYAWDGPTIKRHRAEIRRFFGFRTFTVADHDKLTGPSVWPSSSVCIPKPCAAGSGRQRPMPARVTTG